MGGCEYYGSSISGIAYQCSYCDQTYCAEHRLPESHDCPQIGVAVSPPSHGELHKGDERIARKSRAARERREDWYDQRGETPYETIDPGTVGTTHDDEALGDKSPDVALDGSIAEDTDSADVGDDGQSWRVTARAVGFWVGIFGGAIPLLIVILLVSGVL